MRRRILVWILASLLGGYAHSAGHDRKAARKAFAQAEKYLKQLWAQPLEEREAKEYNRAIQLYYRVVHHDPTYGASDDALYHIARLYDEKAQRFGDAKDLQQAIHYYEFVAREYPLTKHKEAALKRARHLRKPPGEAAPKRAAPQPESGDRVTLRKIRYWSGPEYTRVVIETDGEVEYEKNVLSDPYRVYFDLLGTRVRSGLADLYEVNDVFIKSVRVGKNRPGVVRVVLDFDQPGDTTVFRLFDPFRIVIDTSAQDAKRDAQRRVKTASAEIALEEGTATTKSTSELADAPSPNLSGDYSLTRTLGLKVGRIVIDPGHGGHDTGAVGRGGLKEKDLVLDVSKRLAKVLEERLRTDVVLTREEDVFIPLEERTAIANQQGADLFVSIHANSSRDRRAQGLETFYLNLATTADEREVASRENASSQRTIRELESLLRQITKGDYNEESRDLAHVVQKHLYQHLEKDRSKFRNRGVKRAPFIVLVGSNMPSILTEVGFVSHPDEEAYLKKSAARQRIAEALYKGIESYFQSLGGSSATQGQ